MSAITVTPSAVAAVFTGDSRIRAMKFVEAVTAGQAIYRTTAGLGGIAGAAAAGKQEFVGISLSKKDAGSVGNVLEEGEAFGFDLSGLAYDAQVYLSDTLGALDTAAGTKTVCVARVVAITDDTVLTKALRIYSLTALKH